MEAPLRPSDSGRAVGHWMRALGRMSAMTNYALFCQSRKANEKPYALYAPLLGVGVFSAFFLLRELHTVHTTAYGSHWNPALALLPVGIEASSARRKQKAHTDPHTDFADFRRNRPPMKLIRLCPSLIPIDARAGFCPWKRFFGPSDGLSSFWGIVCRHPTHTVPQGGAKDSIFRQ